MPDGKIATTGQLSVEYGMIARVRGDIEPQYRSDDPKNSVYFYPGNAPGTSPYMVSGRPNRFIYLMNIESIEPYSPSVMTSGFDFKPLLTAGLIVSGVYLAIMALKPK
jgi:hypothetical protein